MTAKAHGGLIDIQGVTVAHMSDKMQVTKLETWFDPVDMFRQISPEGVVKKEVVAAAVAQGCPVLGHQAAAETDKVAVQEHLLKLEKHGAEVTSPEQAITTQVGDEVIMETASLAEKAVVDGNAGLDGNVTASEVDPQNGEIPRPNAE